MFPGKRSCVTGALVPVRVAATHGGRDINYKNENDRTGQPWTAGLEAQVDIGDFAGIDHDFTAAG